MNRIYWISVITQIKIRTDINMIVFKHSNRYSPNIIISYCRVVFFSANPPRLLPKFEHSASRRGATAMLRFAKNLDYPLRLGVSITLRGLRLPHFFFRA